MIYLVKLARQWHMQKVSRAKLSFKQDALEYTALIQRYNKCHDKIFGRHSPPQQL